MRGKMMSTVALGALVISAPVLAQAEKSQIEEIVVTAQKRTERLQDVPIAVTAFTALRLQKAAITGTTAIAQVTPGLVFNQVEMSVLPFLRGVGTQSNVVGDESHVALYVDGVYWPSMPGAVFSLSNVARVEVLKGPQGTLFGRNADGGLIQIITKDPSQTPSLDVTAGYGNYNTYQGQLYATAGITPKLAADISLFRSDQQDGYGKNLYDNTDANYQVETAARSKWVLKADDATKLTLAVDYERVSSDFGTAIRLAPGGLGLDGKPYTGGFYDIDANFDPQGTTTQWGGSLRVEHSLSWGDFAATSAYRYVHDRTQFDYDGTALPVADVPISQYTRSYSQELQLQSLPLSQLKWIAGFYYYNATDGYNPLSIEGFATAPIGFENEFAQQYTNSYSAFGQATTQVLPATNLTLGLRYTVDYRDLKGHTDSDLGPGSLGVADTSVMYPKLTWRLALDHHFSDTLMGYISDNRGFKSGVYNLTSITDPPVRPETLDAYEIGLKSELFDHRVIANVAAFYYNEKDIQLIEIKQLLTQLENAASGETKGIDLDVTARATDALDLQFGAEYLDAHYTSFPDAPNNIPNPAGGDTVSVENAAGNDMIEAPKLTINLGANYKVPTRVGDWNFNVSYYYNNGYFFEPNNRLQQPSYSLINTTAGWTSPNALWRVSLWAKNLLDQKYYRTLDSSALGDEASAGDPRTFGITISRHFGG